MGLMRKLNGVVHMNCRQASEMYSRSMDGTLPLKELIRFKIHYLACAPCRFYCAQLEWLKAALRKYREGFEQGIIPPAKNLSVDARQRIAEALAAAQRQ